MEHFFEEGGLGLYREWISGQTGTDIFLGNQGGKLKSQLAGFGVSCGKWVKYWVGSKRRVTGGASVDGGIGIPSCPLSCNQNYGKEPCSCLGLWTQKLSKEGCVLRRQPPLACGQESRCAGALGGQSQEYPANRTPPTW